MRAKIIVRRLNDAKKCAPNRPQQWWQQGLPPTVVSYPAFQSTIKQHVLHLDVGEVEWRRALDEAPTRPSALGFSARLHYLQFKTTYGAESYLLHDDRKSAMYKFYLRSGNFDLKARIVHDVPPDSPLRCCDFCPDSKVKDEFHFLMECVAYTDSRKYMWLNIEHNLCFDHLFNEWRCISNAPDVEKFRYLLGYCEADWDVKCEATLDRFVRLYSLSSAAKRKARLSNA
jgi:hypothetical protein